MNINEKNLVERMRELQNSFFIKYGLMISGAIAKFMKY